MKATFNFLCKRNFPAILLILLAGSIVYSNTFDVPFVLDDDRSIVSNPVAKNPEKVFQAYQQGLPYVQNRFVAYLTFALNYQTSGLNLAGFHLVNLLIHLASGLLVYCLLRLTFRTPYFQHGGLNDKALMPGDAFGGAKCAIPLLAGLLFVVHPVQTQAVTYIVQRMTSLATMFYLLSLVLYVKARLYSDDSSEEKKFGRAARRMGLLIFLTGSILATILAMKTKEIAFTLPFAIALYEIYFFRGHWIRRTLYLLPILATLPIIPLTVLGFFNFDGETTSSEWQMPEDDVLRVQTPLSRIDYLFTQCRVIVTYLRLIILPINQNLDYDYPVYSSILSPEVFMSAVFLAALCGIAIYLFFISRARVEEPEKPFRPALRLVSFGLIWFFLTLSVESSLIPIVDVIVEHRIYLPFLGAATAISTLFYLLSLRFFQPEVGKKVFFSGAILLILALGVATWERNQLWRDPVQLWQDTAAKSPNKARPLNNLGKALEESGNRAEAFKLFARAIRVNPRYYKAYYNLADLYLVSDQPDKALQLLQVAIQLNPDFTEAYVSIGAALMRSGQFQQVATFLEQNLERIADQAEARFYLGAAYAFLGNRQGALRELKVLNRLDSSYAENLRGMMGMNSNHGESTQKHR